MMSRARVEQLLAQANATGKVFFFKLEGGGVVKSGAAAKCDDAALKKLLPFFI
jgi:hypothetical protein